ncbi:excinuclease ABC subunit UvrA [Pontibacter sp. G13]|uniref:excinuclease ABC subunit UvrA n=1 Tax=Pontibacter sp. G13 TaxID=3074898 RepID=UPI00288AEE2B|nr:excinuclease ABC subunit UvrA [Pontibacter sp. G13]WNJ19559.1 excinuclease ABC subunit UvrA [Pontibacter sp. G13]
MSQSFEKQITVLGAREHNLKNIDIQIPRDNLVVITGVSGSGKSSLAFDTIYAEGQRRYLESFSAYARQFLGNLKSPDVDKIDGLSPVIAIEQKTTSRNPRSTVGTVTEIYDLFRLLYARAADAYSYKTGKKMVKMSDDQVIDAIQDQFPNKKMLVAAPLVRSRKGHYRELFENLRKQGYTRVRVDGEVEEIESGMKVDRYKIHDIELVVDRIVVGKDANRLGESVRKAMKMGEGTVLLVDHETEDTFWYSRNLMDPESGISYDVPSPNTFSFNSPYGACPNCNGLGKVFEVNPTALVPDPSLSINRGAIAPLGEYRDIWMFKQLRKIADLYEFSLSTPFEEIPDEAVKFILDGKKEGKAKGLRIRFEGIRKFVKDSYQSSSSEKIKSWAEGFMQVNTCPTCEGTRLKPESLYFRIDGKHIAELAQMDIGSLAEWIKDLETRLSERQQKIGEEVIKELKKRIGFLTQVGLNYLALDRPARSLSGGEAQRIRLATQIGSQLVNVLYILDEPSIGLHQRDNEKLIQSLIDLRDLGNSVLVVEHDKDTMLAADYIIDFGPGAGVYGGQIVSAGTPGEMLKSHTPTADYLSNRKQIEIPEERRKPQPNELVLKQATGNNLKGVDLTLPLGIFVCVTGVSGSGKSTLINETLYPIISQYLYKSKKKPMPYQSLDGIDYVNKVVRIDQSPIGRTPRSNPATYTGLFTLIRQMFAQLPEAKARGYKIGRFSFNVKGGRCEECQGAGVKTIEMNFLPDVYVTCPRCQGARYNRETLEIRYRGKSISDVLNMDVTEALEFFDAMPRIKRILKTIHDVGLGYITLGQPATTLSGGEAQRIKIASELSKKDTGNTLYILDEPTTGLHFQDIEMLLQVLNQLVNRGNTVLVIEHNLDVIKVADYVIDLGPEGGAGGGRIIAQGTPEEVAMVEESHTGRFLKRDLIEAGVSFPD